MKTRFIAHTILDLNYHPGNNSSLHDGCSIVLDVVPPLNPEAYMEQNGVLKKDGSKVMTHILVQGLVANIHLSHQQGWRDSAEHLRYIIKELERGFIEAPTITTEKL